MTEFTHVSMYSNLFKHSSLVSVIAPHLSKCMAFLTELSCRTQAETEIALVLSALMDCFMRAALASSELAVFSSCLVDG